MTWLRKRDVATQLLKAKQHRRYPDSDRPSSGDRRMVFLGIAAAAGVWEIEFSTALRKLAEAGLGLERMAAEVHRMDRLEEMMKPQLWAEPVGNYFIPSPDGLWEQVRELPCKVPADWEGGYILYGYVPSGFLSTFSRTLPSDLLESVLSAQGLSNPVKKKIRGKITIHKRDRRTNVVRCGCGATICARSRKLALEALAEHKRMVHDPPPKSY